MNKNNLKIYRQRYIPKEKILLNNDIILDVYEDKIITKWNVLKSKKEFSHGYSCYFIKNGFKVSKLFRKDNTLLYTYCDIIETEYDNLENSFVFKDLLVDVIVYTNGLVKVLDLEEIAEALDKKLISIEQVKKAMILTNDLLEIIYSGKFEQLTSHLSKYIEQEVVGC